MKKKEEELSKTSIYPSGNQGNYYSQKSYINQQNNNYQGISNNGGYGPSYVTGYPPQQGYGSGLGYPPYQPGYAQTSGGYQPVLVCSHEHGLLKQPSNDTCKFCGKSIGGQAAYVCHQCPLVLCHDCSMSIFYGNRVKKVHQHSLCLRLRNSYKCDLCKQQLRSTISFYCRICDFDYCTKCYIAF